MWAVEFHRLSLKLIGLWSKIEKSSETNLWSEIRIDIILILLIFISISHDIYGYARLGQYDTCNRCFTYHITFADSNSEIYYRAMETNKYVQYYLKENSNYTSLFY